MLRVAFLLVIPLVLVITLFAGCGEDEAGSISGNIVAGENISDVLGGYPGFPISGALVYIPDTSYYDITDENGRFYIGDIPEGTYVLRASLIYSTIAETEIEVESGKRARVANLKASVPTYFIGGWNNLGFYDEENHTYIGDVYVHMGPDPTTTQLIRGDLHALGDEDDYLDDSISIIVDVNGVNPVPVKLEKNLFLYELHTMLVVGKNVVLIRATNPKGEVQVRTLSLYYYPYGLVASLEWDGEGDMDLHLTGPDGTSCFYGETNLDWGVTEESLEASLSQSGVESDIDIEYEAGVDNPIFHYDRRTGWGTGGETIALQEPPPGDYAIKVRFYGCAYPSLKTEPIKPSVAIYLDGKRYLFVKDTYMHLDDEWEVTSFTLPGGAPVLPGE